MAVTTPPDPVAHPLGIKAAQEFPSYIPILGVVNPPVMVMSIMVELATKEYHTSAAGEGISGPT